MAENRDSSCVGGTGLHLNVIFGNSLCLSLKLFAVCDWKQIFALYIVTLNRKALMTTKRIWNLTKEKVHGRGSVDEEQSRRREEKSE